MYLRPSDINIGRGPVKLNGFIINTKIIYPVISIDGIFFLVGMIDDYLLPFQLSGSVFDFIHRKFIKRVRQYNVLSATFSTATAIIDIGQRLNLLLG